ncbi:MAG: LemA family protein [Saprospiraceae bacterium]
MKLSNLIILGILLLLTFMGCNSYNGMVQSSEGVTAKWANVENLYQRRSDLIPNLVATVKQAASTEQAILTQVIEARSRATQIKIDPTNATPEQLAEFQKRQGELGSALGRLLMVTEQYPQLQSIQGFGDLRAELAGSENRLAVARQDFNTVVLAYNTSVKRFPANLFASIFGFKERAYFQAEAGSKTNPNVGNLFNN